MKFLTQDKAKQELNRKMGHMEDVVSLTMSVNDESAPSDDSLKYISRSISLRSYNKWSPTEHGVTLAWRDVSIYAAKNRKSIKRIINNATGAITSGSLVALMGSSGSGKTTLMSSLANRIPGLLKAHFPLLNFMNLLCSWNDSQR